jgi:hypothetical protein
MSLFVINAKKRSGMSNYEFTDFSTLRTVIISECRNCGHSHNENRKCILKLFEYPVCNCINWAPMDNLEYLEQLYNKKVKDNV